MNKIKAILSLVFVITFLAACSGSGNNEQEAQSFIERSKVYESQGQFRAAMIEMRNAVQANPSDNDIYIRYAELLLKIGNPQQAADLLNSLEGPYAKVLLADAYVGLGKHLSAREALAQANTDSYRSEDTALVLAKAEFVQGKRDEAIADMKTLAEERADTLPAIELAKMLISVENTKEANEWLSKAAAKDPENPEIIYLKALAAYQDRDFTTAEERLTEALALLPESDIVVGLRLDSLELMSRVMTNLGRSTEALVYNRIIENSNPEGFAAQQQFADAMEAAANGDLETAKSIFQDILNQFPDNQRAALVLGMVEIDQGNLEEGEFLLSENIDAEVATIPMIRATALAQSQLGKEEEALSIVERALLARPDDPDLLSIFGIISINAGDEAKGIEAVSKAIQLEPNNTRLYLLLAQHYNEKEQPELALGYLRKAFAVNPTDWTTATFYIASLLEQDESNELDDVFTELTTTYSNDPVAQWLAASIDYSTGNAEAAKTRLLDAYREAKTINSIVTTYAGLLERENEFEESADVWLTALNNNPRNVSFLENAVNAKLNSEDRSGTIEWLKAQKQTYPDASLPLDAGIVRLLIMEGRIAEADTISSRYSTSQELLAKRFRADTYRALASQAAEGDDFSEALRFIDLAFDLQPTDQALTIFASQIEYRLKGEDAAEKRLRDFINANDNNGLVLNALGDLIRSADGEQAAYNYLQPYWQDKPSSAYARLFLGLTRSLVPVRYEDALNELLDAEPQSPIGNLLKGDWYLGQGNEETAKDYYQRAVDSNRNFVPALNNLAWIIAKTDPATALTYSSRAVQLAPTNANVLDTHGRALYLNGDKEAAIQTLERALELDPDNADIQGHLAEARS